MEKKSAEKTERNKELQQKVEELEQERDLERKRNEKLQVKVQKVEEESQEEMERSKVLQGRVREMEIKMEEALRCLLPRVEDKKHKVRHTPS